MRRAIALTVLLLLPIAGCLHQNGQPATADSLAGIAEDLWGNRIDLAERSKGTVLILPYSPANCGYCLFDGSFVAANLIEPAVAHGDAVFRQCLFNPQLDILTFAKHERDATTPVLTFPPSLHRYHRDGFPFAAVFRDGRRVFAGPVSPYEQTVDSLRSALWPESGGLTVTSPLHMATRFVFENRDTLAVVVLPDGDEKEMAAWTARLASRPERSFAVSYESRLTPVDLTRNLCYTGPLSRFRHDALAGQEVPIAFTAGEIGLGGHRFPKSQVDLSACFPNPRHRGRYVVLCGAVFRNDLDYTLCRDGASPGQRQVLLEGFFAKPRPGRWEYSDSLAFGPLRGTRGCTGARCPAPATGAMRTGSAAREAVTEWHAVPGGSLRRCGEREAHFPALAVTGSGACWVAWEERGDILLARVDEERAASAIAIEDDSSDSFHPVLAAAGERLWILFLNDRDGFYRLYGRSLEGGRLSETTPVSPLGSFDVVTPAAVADRAGDITVAWSEWRANFRYLRYGRLREGRVDSVRTVATCPSEIEYTNAWFPSLAVDGQGRVWGAWNQHYPGLLSVCSGSLADTAVAVNRPGNNGGYPTIVVDAEGRRVILWEGFGWDVLDGRPQRILCASCDPGQRAWSAAETVDDGIATHFNQTPRAAVGPDGTIWAVWSGRDREGARPWSVYLSRREGGRWSPPERISAEETNARAPAIAAGRDGRVWIAWHAGTGATMRVEVLNFRRRPGGQSTS